MKKNLFIACVCLGISTIQAVDLQPTQQTTLWFTNTYSGIVKVTVVNANNNRITKKLNFSDKKSITIPGVVEAIIAETSKQGQTISTTKTGTPSGQSFTIAPCSGSTNCLEFIE